MDDRAKTTIEIVSNGSGTIRPLADLFAALERHTLSPTFEEYGNFVSETADGRISFFGNFHDYSHVFQIITDDRDLIDRLTAAIRANQATREYVAARAEVAAGRAALLAHDEAMRRRLRGAA